MLATKRWTAIASTVTLMAAVAVVPSQTAAAQGTAQAPVSQSTAHTVVTAMHIVGFNRDIAAEHGYRIVVKDGVEQSIPANRHAAPLNTVRKGGNCGYAWLTLTGEHLAYHYYTGFRINSVAVDYNWDVDVFGPYYYQRDLHWGGGLAFRSGWDEGGTIPVDDSGYYDGAVVYGPSYAILWDGGVCYAAKGIEPRTYVS